MAKFKKDGKRAVSYTHLLVAESAIKGGAMATARLAMSYDREVMRCV